MRTVLLYCFIFTVFNYSCGKLQYIKTRSARRSNDTQAESLFSDVIKNITRVNNVLEDLIKNYEKLKNIYKSTEIVADYSSDGEVDEVYKRNRAKGKQGALSSTTKNINEPATQMYFSEEHVKGESSDDDEKSLENNATDTKATNVKEKETAISTNTISKDNKNTGNQNIKIKEDKKGIFRETNHNMKVKQMPTIEFLTSNRNKPANDTKKESVKKNNQKTPKPATVSTTTGKNADVEESNESDNSESNSASNYNSTASEQTERDISESTSGEIKPTDRVNRTAIKTIPTTIGAKTTKAQPKIFANESIYRKIKQVIKTEGFSKNHIWDEVIHKPVKLKTVNELVYQQPEIYFRNQMTHKTEFPHYNKRKMSQRKVSKQQNSKPTPKYPKTIMHSLESLEDEKNIMKEQFKTRILRKAYGDACLKVVVKKCYKACKAALEVACEQYSCKSRLKSSFETNARHGCIHEFEEPQQNNITNNYTNEVHFDNMTRDTNNKWHFKDITRSGYLAAACLPSSKINKPHPQLRASEDLNNTEVQLNILRDRFERECQKISSGKCNEACHYAVKKTCEQVTCSKGEKHSLNKKCERECKKSYRYAGSDSSSSDSDDTESESSDDSSIERPKRGTSTIRTTKFPTVTTTTVPSTPTKVNKATDLTWPEITDHIWPETIENPELTTPHSKKLKRLKTNKDKKKMRSLNVKVDVIGR